MSFFGSIFTSEENQEILWARIFGITVVLVLILQFIFHVPGSRRKRLFRRYVLRFGRTYNRHAAQQIAEFLSEVRQACLVSGQPPLTVVEIGPGPYPSLKAYPPGTKLICIEPCNEFNKYIENEWKKSHLGPNNQADETPRNSGLSSSSSSSSLSGPESPSDSEHVTPDGQLLIYNVTAERMAEVVGSKAADIVVGRQVMCSVDDVSTVLAQISEVLKPGGQYFFYEHVRSESKFTRIFQTLLAFPPFSYLTGCDLRRKLFADPVSGFSRFEVKSFSVTLPWYMFPYAHTVTGCAVK